MKTALVNPTDYSELLEITNECTDECISYISRHHKDSTRKKFVEYCRDCAIKIHKLTNALREDTPDKLNIMQECTLMCEYAVFEFNREQSVKKSDLINHLSQCVEISRSLLNMQFNRKNGAHESPPAQKTN